MHRSDSSRQELPARATHPSEQEQASFLTFPPSNPCRVSANAGSHHAVVRLRNRDEKQALCQFLAECNSTNDVSGFPAFPEDPRGDSCTATRNCSANRTWSTPISSHQCPTFAQFHGFLVERQSQQEVAEPQPLDSCLSTSRRCPIISRKSRV